MLEAVEGRRDQHRHLLAYLVQHPLHLGALGGVVFQMQAEVEQGKFQLAQHLQRRLEVAGRQHALQFGFGQRLAGLVVITSYSIHYTKLYEPFDRLSLLPGLLAVYCQVLAALAERGIDWVQIDEPALVLDLPAEWQAAYRHAYAELRSPVRLLLSTYFGAVDHQLDWLTSLPIQGLHLDCVAGAEQLTEVLPRLPDHWQISLGVINGRNIWRADLAAWQQTLAPLARQLGDRLWLGSSCSLLHSPLDLNAETGLDEETRSWFAFARQKCIELHLLRQALVLPNDERLARLTAYSAPLRQRRHSVRVQDPDVQARVAAIRPQDAQRTRPYAELV